MNLAYTPKVDPTYKPTHIDFSSRLNTLSKRGDIVNVLVTGPTGSGKTSWGEQFAAQHQRPFFVLECGAISESEQLIGQWEIKPNSDGPGAHTEFLMSGFLHAVQTPHAVILCNEINRFQSIKAENVLFGLLDYQRALYINELKDTVRVAPGVTFIATINEGAEYTGTDHMDLAFRNRWSRYINITWLPEDQEIEILTARTGIDTTRAEQLVILAGNLRGEGSSPISLRQLQAASEELMLGAGIQEAVMTTFAGVCDREQLATMAAATIGDWNKPQPTRTP